eukprot:3149252-Amphidinium_carterae.1
MKMLANLPQRNAVHHITLARIADRLINVLEYILAARRQLETQLVLSCGKGTVAPSRSLNYLRANLLVLPSSTRVVLRS